MQKEVTLTPGFHHKRRFPPEPLTPVLEYNPEVEEIGSRIFLRNLFGSTYWYTKKYRGEKALISIGQCKSIFYDPFTYITRINQRWYTTSFMYHSGIKGFISHSLRDQGPLEPFAGHRNRVRIIYKIC